MAKLFHVPLSPFCRKVRLSLAEKKIEVELVEERYWEQDADFMRRNPAGKVPVLRMDGITMAESGPICEYIEETRPEPPLLPKDPARGRRCGAWWAGLTTSFTSEVTSNCSMSGSIRRSWGKATPIAAMSKRGQRRSSITWITWPGCWITAAGWPAT